MEGGFPMDQRPIGVFDSGVGGLSVVRELCRLLPGEDIVYFGDVGRVPYRHPQPGGHLPLCLGGSALSPGPG